MTKRHRRGYIFRRGRVWWIQYALAGEVIRESLGTDSKLEAERLRTEKMRPLLAAEKTEALAAIAARLDAARTEQARVENEAHPPLTLADTWAAYEATPTRPDSGERTLAGYESAWKRFLEWMNTEHPAALYVREIGPEIAQAYAQSLTTARLSASTFNQYIGALRLVWRVLAKAIRGDGNPWAEIAKRRVQKLAHRRRSLTPDQFNALLAAVGNADLHDLLFTLGWTGQRLFDGVFLRWDSIDFRRRVITLHPRKTRRTGKAVHIPLMPPLAELLLNRKEHGAGPLVFPELAAAYERDPSAITKRIQSAFERAGLTPREVKPGIRRAVVVYGAHSLRHYFATQALAAGVPGEIVKRITGHTSDAMLEGYEHVDAKMIGGLAAKLSANPARALPPADLAARVRKLAEQLTAKNAAKVKKELLALCH